MVGSKFKVIRKPEAATLAGISKTNLYMQVKAGTFPPPIALGARAVGFLEHEVQAILAARSIGQSDDSLQSLVSSLVQMRQGIANDLLAKLTHSTGEPK